MDHLYKYILLILVVVNCQSSFGDGGGASEKNALIDAVVGGFADNAARLRSLDVEYEMNCATTPEGLKRYKGMPDTFINLKRSRIAKQHLWIQGAKTRYQTDVLNGGENIGKEITVQPMTVTVNDTIKQQLHKVGGMEATFIIDRKDSKLGRHFTLLDFGYRGGGLPLNQFLRSKNWVIEDAHEVDSRDGKNVLICVRPEGVSSEESFMFKFWINPQKGFLATRIQTVLPSGTVISELESDVQEIQPGIWLPVSGISRRYVVTKEGDKEVLALSDITELKKVEAGAFRINTNIPENMFDQRIPNPAYVIDKIKDITYYYGDHPDSPKTSALAMLESGKNEPQTGKVITRDVSSAKTPKNTDRVHGEAQGNHIGSPGQSDLMREAAYIPFYVVMGILIVLLVIVTAGGLWKLKTERGVTSAGK